MENVLAFSHVTFAYPAEEKAQKPNVIFSDFSASFPGGVTSLVGQNGCGKTTFLLLSSGRLSPEEGSCSLFSRNPAALAEEKRNELASVVYQNMEFESKESVQSLLAHVYQNGTFGGKAMAVRSSRDLLSEVIDVFELDKVLSHGLTEISKGEIQRVLLAFSVLYGSASLFMDEPLFAMEEGQKFRAMDYIAEFAHKTGTPLFISLHELELSRRFADNVLLFYPNRDMAFGTPAEVLTNADLERAYGVPASMLKESEDMTRESLRRTSEALLGAARK